MRLSPVTSPPYLRLRVWSHSQDPLGHHSSGMNLVPNRGAPSFYLPGLFTRRESQVALDFDPPHACRATQVPFRRMVIFFFPFSLFDRFLHLSFFDGSRGKHGLPNFGRKLATAILWSFSLPLGSHHRLRRRSFDSRRQPHYPLTVVVGTWMTCNKMSSSSKAHAGGFCTARFELSPLPSTATVATWGRRFGANADGRLGFDCPRYTADTCIGF